MKTVDKGLTDRRNYMREKEMQTQKELEKQIMTPKPIQPIKKIRYKSVQKEYQREYQPYKNTSIFKTRR